MATCKVCDEPLLIEVEDENGSDQAQVVPDDLELPCGDHFHWQCLMDQSETVAISLECPVCHKRLAENPAGPSATNPLLHITSGISILARYSNEGGTQESLDILPSITEEAYLSANPEARPARAFHVMCSEGDVEGIVELLQDADQTGGDEPSMSPEKLLRYQDPLANNKSGLHLAIEKAQEEVVWFLLWVASTLPTQVFPEAALIAAQSMQVQRPALSPVDDIRLLQDAQGRTAEAVAAGMDGIWSKMLEAGMLQPAP